MRKNLKRTENTQNPYFEIIFLSLFQFKPKQKPKLNKEKMTSFQQHKMMKIQEKFSFDHLHLIYQQFHFQNQQFKRKS